MPDDTTQSSQANKSPRRWLILACLAAACFGLILVFRAGGSPKYWAYSTVIMRPYTNAVIGRPFERQVVKSVPSIRQMTVSPGFASLTAAMAWSTNKTPSGAALPVSATIRFMVLGSSPQEAQRKANDAAAQLCTLLPQQYSGSVSIIQQADRSGRWLLPYEMKLRVSRLFQR
jgi:hypothetical protein